MRRIHSAQAAEKQSKMEKAKQLTAEAIQKQQNMKVQQNVEVASHSAAIQDLFTASSVKGTAMQGRGSGTLTILIFNTIGIVFEQPIDTSCILQLIVILNSSMKCAFSVF